MDKLLTKFDDYSLWLADRTSLREISNFIIRTNYEFHMGALIFPKDEIEDNYRHIYENHEASYFYILKDNNGDYIGTIKSQKWDQQSPLPIEKMFGIDVKSFAANLPFVTNEIWHIGCFAIDQKKILNDQNLMHKRISILKTLLMCALNHVYPNPRNIFLAECDKKLHQTLRVLKIDCEVIGKSIFYLGSETVPMFNTGKGIKTFFESHRNYSYV